MAQISLRGVSKIYKGGVKAVDDVNLRIENKKLKKGFERSEFLLAHGLIDMIVHRKDLKKRIGQIIEYAQNK